MRYSAFISYNHKDRAWATWLHRALERYRLPKRLRDRETSFGAITDRLPPVFRDRDELATSSDLAQDVREALSQSHSLIVICSPAAAKSRWVNEEIRTFVALGRKDRIRLLIVNGEPHSSDPQFECLPPALLEVMAEPLAADVRKGQDGKTASKLKLLAGILDLPFDELRQREASRRARTLAILAGAASIGFLLMTGLSIFALISRAEAVRQHDLAEQRTVTAERTLDFIQSMFRDADPSMALGKELTVRQVVDTGAEKLARSLNDQPAVKAELGITLSEVYGTLGEYDRSDKLINESMAIRHDQPDITARQYAALGDAQSQMGDYRKAIVSLNRGLAALDKSTITSDGLRSRLLVYRGQAQTGLRAFTEADQSIRKALALDRERLGDRNVDVARDLEVLAQNENAQNDLDAAQANRNRALAIRLALEGPDSPSVNDNMAALADIAMKKGDFATAERINRACLERDMRVLKSDHPDTARTINNLARAKIGLRKYGEALPLAERAVKIGLEKMGAEEPDMAFFLANLAIAKRHTHDLSGAEEYFDKALIIARQTKHRLLGPVLADLAEVRCARGNVAGGLGLIAEARKASKAFYAEEPWRWAWVDNVEGGCLVRAGEVAKGKAMIATSAKIILAKWPRNTMWGWDAVNR